MQFASSLMRMTIHPSRDANEGYSEHEILHPLSSRSSSTQLANCWSNPVVSQPWQLANDPESILGGYQYSQNRNCESSRGQQVRLDTAPVVREYCYSSNRESDVIGAISKEIRGHRVKRSRISYEVQPPIFDGANMSFSDYLDDFMRIADYNEWDEEERKFHIWNSIVGNAKIRIKAMSFSSSLNNILTGLLSVFYNERTVEAYRDKLSNVTRALSMNLETYGYYLLDLVRKAHPTAIPLEQERIAKDCFLQTAGSHNLHVWLKLIIPEQSKSPLTWLFSLNKPWSFKKPWVQRGILA